MGCIKGKLKAKLEKGNFRCRKCGGCSKHKKNICKPELIESDRLEDSTSEDGSKKKKKKKKGK